jgi:hypothetical protein
MHSSTYRRVWLASGDHSRIQAQTRKSEGRGNIEDLGIRMVVYPLEGVIAGRVNQRGGRGKVSSRSEAFVYRYLVSLGTYADRRTTHHQAGGTWSERTVGKGER